MIAQYHCANQDHMGRSVIYDPLTFEFCVHGFLEDVFCNVYIMEYMDVYDKAHGWHHK